MNLGNRQIFSYQRDLVNTSENAFLVNPGMNHKMPREASAFLSHILQDSLLGTVRATAKASLSQNAACTGRTETHHFAYGFFNKTTLRA